MYHLISRFSLIFVFCLFNILSFGQPSKIAKSKGELMDSIFLNNLKNQTNIQQLDSYLDNQYQLTKDKEFLAFGTFMHHWYNADKKSEDFDKLNDIVLKDFAKYPNIQARYFNQIAYMNFIGFQNFERAFDAYMKLEDFLSQNGPEVISRYSYYCGQISSAFYRFKDYKRSIHFGKMGLKYAQNKWDMYNTLGLCYTALNKLDSSNYYLEKAVAEARKLKMPFVNQSISKGNIGYNYYLAGNYTKALPLLTMDYTEAVKFQDWGLAAGSAIPLSQIYIKQKSYKIAESLLIHARKYIQESAQLERLEYFFPAKAQYYEAIGDLKKSLAYRDSSLKAYKYNDSVFNGLLVLRVQQRADLTKIEREKLKLQNYQEVVKIQFLAIGAIVIILGVGYYLYRNYHYRLLRNKQRIEELKRLLNLRQRLSADMHDDIGSSLSSISLYSHSLLMQPQNPEQQYVLTKIKDNAQYIQEQVNDIIWAVNPQMDNLKELVARMRKFGAEITESVDINFHFNCEDQILSLEIDMSWRRNLFLMYKEIINNAVKYSQATQIVVELKLINNQFQVQITDNGIGFDIENTKNGNGLKNLQSRAQNMEAILTLESKLNQGSKITIVSPIV